MNNQYLHCPLFFNGPTDLPFCPNLIQNNIISFLFNADFDFDADVSVSVCVFRSGCCHYSFIVLGGYFGLFSALFYSIADLAWINAFFIDGSNEHWIIRGASSNWASVFRVPCIFHIFCNLTILMDFNLMNFLCCIVFVVVLVAI